LVPRLSAVTLIQDCFLFEKTANTGRANRSRGLDEHPLPKHPWEKAESLRNAGKSVRHEEKDKDLHGSLSDEDARKISIKTAAEIILDDRKQVVPPVPLSNRKRE
jgi:hypothetical protein